MLRTLLVLAIFIPAFYRALKDRFDGLLLYLWFAFFRPQDWMWVDISSLRLSMVLGLVLTVPALFTGIWPNLSHPLSIGSVLFLLAATVAHSNAVNPAVSLEWLGFQARLTLVALMATSLITTRKRLVAAIAVVAGSLGFHAAKAGVASLISGGSRYYDGLSGAFLDNNGYALAVVMTIPFLYALGQTFDMLFDGDVPRWARWCRAGIFAAIPMCALTVVSTFSRAGLLALTAVVLAYLCVLKGRTRVVLAAGALVTAAVVAVALPSGYVERVETIGTYEEIGDVSSLSRLHFWKVAMIMAEAEPLGVGLRNFDNAYNRYDFSGGQFGVNRAVHSSHFEVLAELGYFGTFVWIAQFALAFAVAFRVRSRAKTPGLTPDSSRLLRAMSNAIIASMVGFLVGGSFIALALNDLTWLTFGFLAATDRLATSLCAEALASRETMAADDTAAEVQSEEGSRLPWRPTPRTSKQGPDRFFPGEANV
jgi:probable O-glycosylation ligase (exosortase A-associated)